MTPTPPNWEFCRLHVSHEGALGIGMAWDWEVDDVLGEVL